MEGGAVDAPDGYEEMTPVPSPTLDVRARSEAALVTGAQRWIREALDAWSVDDEAKVALLAPMAVELLGKAALWKTNPVLLVQLNERHEKSLHLLATGPDLATTGLTTIGLRVVLTRLDSILGPLPVLADDLRQLVEVRNGAVHVGTAAASRDVLVDCLAIVIAVLPHLDFDEEEFFGLHTAAVQALVSERRSQVSARVMAKIAKAKAGLQRLSDQLGKDGFATVTRELASQRLTLDADEYVAEGAGVDADCPACGFQARLFGSVEVRPEAEFDVEPLGGGRYESIAYGFWQPALHPQTMVCTVCRLHLADPHELAEAGLPSQAFDVSDEDLGPDFDLQGVIDAATFDEEA